MKSPRLRALIFWALCCDLGLVAKKLISPAANLITDSLRIPGGIGTAFSLMFITLASAVVPGRLSATLISFVQSLIMLLTGHTGSMGILAPIGYIVPGLIIDITLWLARRGSFNLSHACTLATCLASISAAITANMIIFHLWGTAIALYSCVAALSGAICGHLAGKLCYRLQPILNQRSEFK